MLRARPTTVNNIFP